MWLQIQLNFGVSVPPLTPIQSPRSDTKQTTTKVRRTELLPISSLKCEPKKSAKAPRSKTVTRPGAPAAAVSTENTTKSSATKVDAASQSTSRKQKWNALVRKRSPLTFSCDEDVNGVSASVINRAESLASSEIVAARKEDSTERCMKNRRDSDFCSTSSLSAATTSTTSSRSSPRRKKCRLNVDCSVQDRTTASKCSRYCDSDSSRSDSSDSSRSDRHRARRYRRRCCSCRRERHRRRSRYHDRDRDKYSAPAAQSRQRPSVRERESAAGKLPARLAPTDYVLTPPSRVHLEPNPSRHQPSRLGSTPSLSEFIKQEPIDYTFDARVLDGRNHHLNQSLPTVNTNNAANLETSSFVNVRSTLTSANCCEIPLEPVSGASTCLDPRRLRHSSKLDTTQLNRVKCDSFCLRQSLIL